MQQLNSLDFRAAIALGSNLGNSLSHLRNAAKSISQLSSTPHLVRVSHIYRTFPVDCPLDSPIFLNAVIEIEWKEKAEILWKELQRLEIAAGRQRPKPRHAPRSLDLDLLYLGSVVLSTNSICLPHPRVASRRFVLAPLADCAPHRILPHQKLSIQELLDHLPLFPLVEKIKDPLFL